MSVNFEDTKMVDHSLKISRPGFLDIRYLSWNTAIIVRSLKNAAWIEDDIKSSLNSHVYWDTLYIYH